MVWPAAPCRLGFRSAVGVQRAPAVLASKNQATVVQNRFDLPVYHYALLECPVLCDHAIFPPCHVTNGGQPRQPARGSNMQIWSRAAVAPRMTRSENPVNGETCCRPCSLDESVRVLTLSVDDPVNYLEGRRMAPKRSQPRWLDGYAAPGQKVDVSFDGGRLTAVLASSPTLARMESANLDASIVDMLVDGANGSSCLYEAKPGSLFDVSAVRGAGFASPVNSQVTLTSVLEVRPHRCVTALVCIPRIVMAWHSCRSA